MTPMTSPLSIPEGSLDRSLYLTLLRGTKKKKAVTNSAAQGFVQRALTQVHFVVNKDFKRWDPDPSAPKLSLGSSSVAQPGQDEHEQLVGSNDGLQVPHYPDTKLTRDQTLISFLLLR